MSGGPLARLMVGLLLLLAQGLAAAELVIVRGAVRVVGVGPDVNELNFDQLARTGPLYHTVVQRAFKGFGEEGQDVKTHRDAAILQT